MIHNKYKWTGGQLNTQAAGLMNAEYDIVCSTVFAHPSAYRYNECR